MLKISVIDTASEQKIILQGQITGPWALELESVWQGTRDTRVDRKCTVDLNDTTVIDQEGWNVLEKMCKEGAQFLAKGVMTKYSLKCLMKKISNAATPETERS